VGQSEKRLTAEIAENAEKSIRHGLTRD